VVNSDITQIVEIRPESERFLRLLELLGEWYEAGKVLVFVHSQDKCDTLFRDLLKVGAWRGAGGRWRAFWGRRRGAT
jgi:ATP-dependent RNA helicase DDX46/PRP5